MISRYYSQMQRKSGCEVCLSIKRLVVHHHDKNRFNNNRENLITLCSGCHITWHRWERKHRVNVENLRLYFFSFTWVTGVVQARWRKNCDKLLG